MTGPSNSTIEAMIQRTKSLCKIYGEIGANTENMYIIEQECKKGKMATQQLAEITGDEELIAVSANDTKISSVEHKEGKIIFLFVETRIEFDHQKMLKFGLYSLMTTSMISIIFYVFMTYVRNGCSSIKMSQQIETNIDEQVVATSSDMHLKVSTTALIKATTSSSNQITERDVDSSGSIEISRI